MFERIKNDKYLGSIIALAWPAVLEQLLQSAVTYIDTAMVGRIGAGASAAVGLTTSIVWLVICVLGAVGIGAAACVSRADGAGQPEKIQVAAGQSVWISIAFGCAIGALGCAAHKYIPVWMNADAAIRADASEYFMIICLPMVFRAMASILGSVLRGAGNTKTPMKINAGMNLLNIILNFVLIYETRYINVFGMRVTLYGAGMGIRGAAAATAAALTAGGIAMLLAVCLDKKTRLSFTYLKLNRRIIREIFTVGIPVMIQRIISCLAYVVFASLVAGLGTISLAAHSIAITAEEAFYIGGYGMQNAAATLAGNSLGGNDTSMFRSVAKRCIVITVIMLLAAGIALLLLAGPIMSVFTADAQVRALGADVLRIVALSEPVYGILIVIEGMLDGIGDTKAPMVYAFITMWCIRIGISWVCINVFNLGLHAVWCCMVADNVVRAVLMLQRYVRGKWRRKFC